MGVCLFGCLLALVFFFNVHLLGGHLFGCSFVLAFVCLVVCLFGCLFVLVFVCLGISLIGHSWHLFVWTFAC